MKKTEKIKAESAASHKEQPPLSLSPAPERVKSRKGGRCKVIAWPPHPCNLKYFMDPEVHHVEQPLLLQWARAAAGT